MVDDTDMGLGDEEVDHDPIVFGDVKLSEDRKTLLILQPALSVLDKVTIEGMEKELKMALVMLRWDRTTNDYDQMDGEDDNTKELGMHVDDGGEDAEDEAEHTDMRNNRTVFFPPKTPC